MNILYLLKVLDTHKISELVEAIDAPPIDINLALWDATEKGEVEIKWDKDRIKTLKKAVPWHDAELERKLLRVIRRYNNQGESITRGRMTGWIQDPVTRKGYPFHEYLMTLQWLIDNGHVVERKIKIPEIKDKRPYKEFDFLDLAAFDNEAWQKKAVSKWLAEFDNNK